MQGIYNPKNLNDKSRDFWNFRMISVCAKIPNRIKYVILNGLNFHAKNLQNYHGILCIFRTFFGIRSSSTDDNKPRFET